MNLRFASLTALLCLLVAASALASQTIYLPLVTVGEAESPELPEPPQQIMPDDEATLSTISPEFTVSNWHLSQTAWAQINVFDTLDGSLSAPKAMIEPVVEFVWRPFYGVSTAVLLYNLEPDATYAWRVRSSTDGSLWGPWSPIWTFTTASEGELPAAPTLLSPLDGATGVSRRPQLWWDEVEGATRYVVLLGPEGPLQGFLADGPPLVPFADLQGDTAYKWLVCARTGYGWGPYSETWTFRTQPTVSD